MQKCIDDESRKISLTWLEGEGSLDRWRHQRIYNLLKPLVNINKKKTGDSRGWEIWYRRKCID